MGTFGQAALPEQAGHDAGEDRQDVGGGPPHQIAGQGGAGGRPGRDQHAAQGGVRVPQAFEGDGYGADQPGDSEDSRTARKLTLLAGMPTALTQHTNRTNAAD